MEERKTKIYNGRLYLETEKGNLVLVPRGMDDARDLKNSVEGELDVIEIDGQKYVTRDYKTLNKMTPELEEQVYNNGDLEDIIKMNKSIESDKETEVTKLNERGIPR